MGRMNEDNELLPCRYLYKRLGHFIIKVWLFAKQKPFPPPGEPGKKNLPPVKTPANPVHPVPGLYSSGLPSRLSYAVFFTLTAMP